MGVARVVTAHANGYRHVWRGSLFSTFLSPVLYLAAMGVGLGSLVDDRGGAAELAGGGYLEFLAPGMLAAAAMQTAAAESTWPVMAGFKWRRHYYCMLATPLGPTQIALGQLTWIGVRTLQTTAVFALVMALFGAAESPLVVLAVPAATLCGLAYAGAVVAYTAASENDYSLANLFRFGIVPMFLFSGAFFPVEQLPDGVEWLAYLVPLWHGVELCRDLSLGDVDALAAVGHVLYMAAIAAAGGALAVARYWKRLVV